MSQPADQRFSSGSETEDFPARSPRSARRHRRWPLILAVPIALILLSGIIETIVDSSQAGVAIAGALTGLVFGLIGLRHLPPVDEKTRWFGLVRAEGVRDEDPERGGIAWRVLSGLLILTGGAAACFLLFPLIEPFPTAFVYAALVVVMPATSVQWCYPKTLIGRP